MTLLHYGFVVRALEAGTLTAILAPLVGIFLVLRRYSLIADTLAHVSLAGIALGLLLGISPIYTALGITVLSSLGIERLRTTRRVYGESALALFLSGSLAVATILLSLRRGLGANVFNYLFGSIMTVTSKDVRAIGVLTLLVVTVLLLFYKELVYITFDEDCAQVSGIPVRRINTLLIVLSALTVSLAIPVVGVLLIAALIVIPVVTALLFRQSFLRTIVYAEVVSLFSVLSGIVVSFYLNLATGGTIVVIMLAIFLLLLMARQTPQTTQGRVV
jgi:zinc transport system permease protein